MFYMIKYILYYFIFIFAFKVQIIHSHKNKQIKRKLSGPPYVITLTFDPDLSNKYILNDQSIQMFQTNNIKVYIIKEDNSHEDVTSNLVIDSNKVKFNKITNYSKISLEFQTKLTTFKQMFYLTDVASVVFDKSFNSLNVQDMNSLFRKCSNLKSVDVSNLNTLDTTDMSLMFDYCTVLPSLNLSNFAPKNLCNMESMFNGCRQLTSLDLSNFKISNSTDISGIFSSCRSLKYINLKNFDTLYLESSSGFSGLNSLEYCQYYSYNENIKFCQLFNGFNKCSNCTNTNIDEYCEITFNSKTYKFLYKASQLNDIEKECYWFKGIEKCSYLKDFEISYIEFNLDNILCDECNSLFGYYPLERDINSINYDCYKQEDLPNYFLYDNGNIKYFKICDISCNNCTEESEKCVQCNINYYKLKENIDQISSCYNETTKPINYYLVETDSNKYYDQCDTSCLTCVNESQKCDRCNQNYYKLKENEDQFSNCYNNSTKPNNYFLNKDYKFYELCDISCNKCDEESRKCIECNTSYYKLEEKQEQYSYCYNEKTKPLNYYFDYILKRYKKCHSYCESCTEGPNSESANCISCNDKYKKLNLGNCISVNNDENSKYHYENIKFNYEELDDEIIYKLLLNYINKYYSYHDHVLQYSNDEYKITLFNIGVNNTNNIDYNKLNISQIEFNDCLLNIINNNSLKYDLIYLQSDDINNIRKEHFLIYSPEDNKTLDINICENTTTKLNKYIYINDETKKILLEAIEQGYNLLDINDKFYTQLCTPYTTQNGTDIILIDRINEIYIFDILETYNNCDYDSFNISSNFIKCDTEVKSDFYNEDEGIKFDKQQIIDRFKFKYSNILVIKCYLLFFSIKGQSSNYGAYLLYICLFFVLIAIIINYYKGFTFIKNLFQKIINEKIYNNIKPSSEDNSDNYSSNNLSKILSKTNRKKKNNKIIDKNNNDMIIIGKVRKKENKVNRCSPPKKSFTNKGNSFKLNKSDSKLILMKDTKKKFLRTKKKIKSIKSVIKRNSDIKIKQTIIKNVNKNEIENKINKENKSFKNSSKLQKNINKIRDNSLQIFQLSDFEKNELEYFQAKIYDKRTYFQYYLSLIKIKHALITIFANDYNIKGVKFILFINSFCLSLAVNGLFFNDKTMHKIYIDNGIFDIVYQIPHIIYSSIIPSIISIILKKLSLIHKDFINFKTNKCIKNKNDAINEARRITKKIKIRLIIFSILVFIILVFLSYFVGCF